MRFLDQTYIIHLEMIELTYFIINQATQRLNIKYIHIEFLRFTKIVFLIFFIRKFDHTDNTLIHVVLHVTF